jgi:LPS export ABC transporter protein LptC
MSATAAPSTTSEEDREAAPRRRHLPSLTVRRRTTGEAAAERAVMMRRLRIALPVAAVLLVAAFFLNARTGGGDQAFLDDFADVAATTQNLSSTNPQFAGVDSSGAPYEITADSASQTADRREIVELANPRAVTAAAQSRSVVAAKAGVFNTEDKELLLKDGVIFERTVGLEDYVLKTEAARVSIDRQTMVSEEKVSGAGPRGEALVADRMRADNRAGRLIFEGNVSLRIYPSTRAENEGENASEEAND